MLSHARKSAPALLGTLALTASLVALAAPGAQAAPTDSSTSGAYVALGDSYAAGAGVPDQSDGLCLRSDHNYGHLVAAALNSSSYTDVTCSAAKIKDITSSQIDVLLKVNDPQIDALSSGTRLVTLGIGGNDLGTSTLGIGDVIATCIAGAVVNPAGTPCKDVYADGHWVWSWSSFSWSWQYGEDTLVDRINTAAPALASTLQQIHAKAPNAKVLLVGYPSVLPDDASECAGRQPVTVGDVAYLHGILGQLNDMLAGTAAANGATYVDTATPTKGHDVCSDDRWIEGALPGSPAVPFHPNATGEQAMANAVLAALH
ncbi:lysophospholipase L1-like esterase [Kitasatospora sp. MAP12-15]|uniref:SGNH/GDSL hydrolase family protein n=1 Tax=unclassified Kitasatospora TaxID=2633591 RepID=UPI0024742632|nr:SGNH/GDSL hydrolase family protein [Kitasatospora sp. MAP12-44]MDH6109836.1 lysophospholipase L1-like esterase [Kitasatospora sp. MAP12-44]